MIREGWSVGRLLQYKRSQGKGIFRYGFKTGPTDGVRTDAYLIIILGREGGRNGHAGRYDPD